MTPAERYLRALTTELGIGAAAIERPSTIVLPEPDRTDTGLAVAYALGELVAIRCDPALARTLEPLTSKTSALTFDAFEAWSVERSWQVIDGNDNHVLPDDVVVSDVTPPEGATLVDLDTSTDETRALIAELVEATGPGDADEAEVELDALDDFAVACLTDDGVMAAFASARPWEVDGSFDDIGVLVHPEHRRGGWGSGVVAALVARSLDRGTHPLYRCNWSLVGSKRLAVGLGFETVSSLLAVSAST